MSARLKSKNSDYFFELSIASKIFGSLSLLLIFACSTFAQTVSTEFKSIRRRNPLLIPSSKTQLNNKRDVGNDISKLVVGNSTQLVATPTLSINDVTVNEGDDGVLNFATFTVSLSAPSQQTVSVMASTQQGTATSDIDFVSGSLTLTIDPGKTSQTITVFVKGDSTVEGSEQFFLNLSNPVNAVIGDSQGVATIVDDDTLILLTESNTQRAIALDSVLFTRDPFPIRNDINLSADHRTRLILFAIGLKLLPGENASAVTATAEDSQGNIHTLQLEFVGKPPTYDWLTQVVVRLNDQITIVGDSKIKIVLHGVSSNTVLVGLKPQ